MSFQYNEFAQQQQGGSASPTGVPAGGATAVPGQPSASPAPYNNGQAPGSANTPQDGAKTTLW